MKNKAFPLKIQFLRHRKVYLEKSILQKRFETLAREQYQLQQRTMANEWTFWTELSIIILALSIVPILMISVLVFWPKNEFFVPVKIKEQHVLKMKLTRKKCCEIQCCQIRPFVTIWATFSIIWQSIFWFGNLGIWRLFGLLFKMNQKLV